MVAQYFMFRIIVGEILCLLLSKRERVFFFNDLLVLEVVDLELFIHLLEVSLLFRYRSDSDSFADQAHLIARGILLATTFTL